MLTLGTGAAILFVHAMSKVAHPAHASAFRLTIVQAFS